ncbi:MAG: glutathione S-transferase N-terminal domain-containing protein [Solirubrobacterales bacterium]
MSKPVLYRCPTPTNSLCSCGSTARALKAQGVDFESRKVPFSKKKRPEIRELTGQAKVPVLVHGEEIITDSKRIKEYVERTWGTR